MVISAFFKANQEWMKRCRRTVGRGRNEYRGRDLRHERLIRDVFASSVKDPLSRDQDVFRESQIGGIVIKIPLSVALGESGYLYVPNPSALKVTSLVRLGGTEVMKEGTNVEVVTPALEPGAVVVRIQTLTAALHPAGVYVGFLYEDKLVVSQIVVLRG